jgi:hypothetical protein
LQQSTLLEQTSPAVRHRPKPAHLMSPSEASTQEPEQHTAPEAEQSSPSGRHPGRLRQFTPLHEFEQHWASSVHTAPSV